MFVFKSERADFVSRNCSDILRPLPALHCSVLFSLDLLIHGLHVVKIILSIIQTDILQQLILNLVLKQRFMNKLLLSRNSWTGNNFRWKVLTNLVNKRRSRSPCLSFFCLHLSCSESFLWLIIPWSVVWLTLLANNSFAEFNNNYYDNCVIFMYVINIYTNTAKYKQTPLNNDTHHYIHSSFLVVFYLPLHWNIYLQLSPG